MPSAFLVGRPAQSADAIVAADGSGQYKTVQEAINAVPQTTTATRRWTILIKAGTYRELVYVQREKRFVTLVGEDPTRTILTYNLHASLPGPDGLPIGTFRTASTVVDADDFTAENLTFENSAGPVGQALAIRVDGDRAIFRNVRFLGWQDTVLLNRGRHYVEASLVTGHVDFVFGGATAFFDRCRVHVWRDGYVTAASTPADQIYGFVFANGRITGDSPAVRTYLGRPWRDFAQVSFVDTEMSDVVRPAGWHNWDRPERERTVRYGESGSRGPGAHAGARVSWAKSLSAEEAASLSVDRVLAGSDGWDPRRVPPHPSAVSALGSLPRPPGPAAPASGAQAAPMSWDQLLTQPAAWYGAAEAQRIADNVLLYQRDAGGWPKDVDMTRALDAADRAAVGRAKAETDATIDNGATVAQMRFLARVHAVSRAAPLRAAFLAGLEYLFRAQYPNGGWPQYFPLRADYSRHVTLNDGAMIGVLTLLRDVGRGTPPVDLVEADGRKRAAEAGARGTQLILQLQIRTGGRLTGWAQQYDEVTRAPAPARSYEHVAIASQETVGVVRFLMGMAQPDSATTPAIDAAVEWLRRVQIRGLRVERRPDPLSPRGFDLVVVDDPAAPPIWARFYEIGTDRPIYSGRDGVRHDRLADIEIERRTGYSWLGPYATKLLAEEYPAWVAGRQRLLSTGTGARPARASH